MKRPEMKRKADYFGRGEDTTPDMIEETMAFGNEIMAAMDGICQQRHDAGQEIHMEALLGAMISIMAHHIAGIPDKQQRQLHYQRTGHELATMIETNIELGTYSKSAFAGPLPEEKLQ